MSHNHRKNSRGAVTIETALVIGVFLLITLGIIDLARIGILKGMLHNAAQLAVTDLKVRDNISADIGIVRTAAANAAINAGRNFLLSGFFTPENTVGNSYSALLADPAGLVGTRTGRLIYPPLSSVTTPILGGAQYQNVNPAGRLTRELTTIPVGATYSAVITPWFFRFFNAITLTETAFGYVEQRQVPANAISPRCFNAGNCPCPFSVPVPGAPPATWNGTNCQCPGGSNSSSSAGTATFSCSCPAGTTFNPTTGSCGCTSPPACPNGWVDNLCGCNTCTGNEVLNPSGTGCQCPGWGLNCHLRTPPRYTSLWDCQCKQCPSGQVVNPTGNGCNCLNPPTCGSSQYATSSCNCANCPANQVQNASGNRCFCPPSFSCSGNQINVNCVCRPCPPPLVANPGNTQCQCPTAPLPCPGTQIRDSTTCACRCPDNTSPTGTVDAGVQCVPNGACPRSDVDCYWNNGNPYQPEDP